MSKADIQLTIAALVIIAGLTLLFMGFWVNPAGVIHNSVLVAFGETMTFSGALIGIDYTYKYKRNLGSQKETDSEEV